MAFPEVVKTQAFARSGGRCECKRQAHPDHPSGACAKLLSRLTAEYHHITAQSVGGSDGLSNCEVLCHPCHALTPSYGR